MKRPRPGCDTEPASVLGETDGAEARVRMDRDRASHLLPRRWRPRKAALPVVRLAEEFADRSESALVARRPRM